MLTNDFSTFHFRSHIAAFSSYYDKDPHERIKSPRILADFKLPDLTGFTNLEHLTLQDMDGNLVQWRKQMVGILSNSPGLRNLEISISQEAVSRLVDASDFSTYYDWFNCLCDEYSKTERAPLALHSLHCGIAIMPTNLALFRQLVNVRGLEDFHIDNQPEDNRLCYDMESDSPIRDVLAAILAAPSLRRFTATTYTPDIYHCFLHLQNPSKTRKMATSFFEIGDCDEDEPFRLLNSSGDGPCPALHFRMLEMELIRS